MTSEIPKDNTAVPEKKSDSDSLQKSLEKEHELDEIHDGLEFPTEEEKATLRRVPDSVPWNAYCG